MDNSRGDGTLVPGAALRSNLLHRGDGEDEERAIRRERHKGIVSGCTQLGAERDAALSGKRRERRGASRLHTRLYHRRRHRWQDTATARVQRVGRRRNSLFRLRTEDLRHKAIHHPQGHHRENRQLVAFRSHQVHAGDSAHTLRLPEGPARRGRVQYIIYGQRQAPEGARQLQTAGHRYT